MAKTSTYFFYAFICALALTTTKCSSNKKRNIINEHKVLHFYSPDSIHYIIYRNDTNSIEVNSEPGGSSYWNISWIDGDTYKSKYLSGKKFNSSAEEQFYLKLETVFNITEIKKDYYLFKSTSDYLDKRFEHSDTIWFKAKQ